MEIELPEIKSLAEEIKALKVEIEKLFPQKLWYSRQDLAALKGMTVSAFYNKPWLLPGPPSKQGGTDRWSHKQVWESGWIWKSDEDLKSKPRKIK